MNNLDKSSKSEKRNHQIEFYQSEQLLYRSVMKFVMEGLKNAEAVIVVSSNSHEQALKLALERQIHSNKLSLENGQLTFINADEFLSKMSVKNSINAAYFHSVLGESVKQARARFGSVRAYGEMVDLLWKRGDIEATIQLENEWAVLLSHHPLTLLCGYHLEDFEKVDHSHPMLEICKMHSHSAETGVPLDLRGDSRKLDAATLLKRHLATLRKKLEDRTKELICSIEVDSKQTSSLNL